jgi:hypothetical protein
VITFSLLKQRSPIVNQTQIICKAHRKVTSFYIHNSMEYTFDLVEIAHSHNTSHLKQVYIQYALLDYRNMKTMKTIAKG